jgi:hypothetical protein
MAEVGLRWWRHDAAEPMEIPMSTQPKTSAKKRLPKVSMRKARTAHPSQPSVTQIDPGKKEQAASKRSRVIAMLQSPGGATITAMMQETGWQPHSVRGFLASVIRRKLKLKLQSNKIDGHRVYRIAGEGSLRASGRQISQRTA